jgi:O-antigen ligase
VRPVLGAFGLAFTLLELAAAVAALVVLAACRAEVVRLVSRPAWPLVLLAAFAAAHLVSAAFAPAYAGLAAKFALRMVAAAALAIAVAATPRRARRAALVALAGSSLLVALLAVMEGVGLSTIDPLLALFRERAFRAGSSPRASAGSGGPNQAAAFLAAGLVAGASRLASRPRLAIAFAGAVSLGLAFTYSRGGLVAALCGLLVLAWASPNGRRAAVASAAVLTALATGFLAHPRFRERVGAEIAEGSYGARYRPADAFLRLAPGEARTLQIELANTGRRDWLTSERPTLHAFLHEWPPREPIATWRHPLAATVAGGDVARASVAIAAPSRPGTYLLVWDLFTLPSGFLSASGTPPAIVPVGVGVDPPEAVTLPERTWRRGRLELWRLAIAMWRDHPLLGVGPDNFRRLHPQYGGWLGAGNFPMSAHNQLLESAATTGLVGLLALAGTIVLSARAAFRARRGRDADVAAVVLALLAAFLVQAQVDALLEFTGHYLLFAFVVGTAAAMDPS